MPENRKGGYTEAIMGPQKLEAFAFFPYVAWTLVFGFALYTGHLAFELKKTFDHLEEECIERSVCIEWRKY